MSQEFSSTQGGASAGTKSGDGMGSSPAAAKTAAIADLKSKCTAPSCYLVGSPVCVSCVDYFGNDCCDMTTYPPSPAPTPAVVPVPMAKAPGGIFHVCRIKICFCDGESLTITRGAASQCVAYCRAFDAARKAACHHHGIRWTQRCGCYIVVDP